MRTLLLALAVGALSACATETAYQPAGPNSDGGYSEQQIESNRVRISFSGNSLTDRETVENYLLFRAAELTLQQNKDYFIIADRATPVPAGIFAGLPGLRVVMRSAIDIRNIDVAGASQAGVLVTQAEAGFVQSVVELTLGLLVDLSRGVSRAAADYHAGRMPDIRVGRQLGAYGRAVTLGGWASSIVARAGASITDVRPGEVQQFCAATRSPEPRTASAAR